MQIALCNSKIKKMVLLDGRKTSNDIKEEISLDVAKIK